MDRRSFVAAVGVFTASTAVAQQQSLRSKIIGLWSLMDAFTVAGDVVEPWFGRRTPITGVIAYHENGMMSVQISGSKPSDISRSDFKASATERKFEFLKEYYAYYARFEVDEPTSTVTHHIIDSLLPYERNTTVKRKLELIGDVLTSITAPREEDGRTTFNRLIWRRTA